VYSFYLFHMLGKIIDQIEKNHGGDAVIGVYLSIMSDIKKTYSLQQKELNNIKNKYSKIQKERLNKKKPIEKALIFFNGIYTGKTNKNNLPDGEGTIMFQSRDKDYPDENDIYMGEFVKGTKTGIGQYTYWNDRNIAQHPTKIPYYVGQWSGDLYYGLGKKIIDTFESLQIYEGEFKNNKIFGFGKYTDKDENGDVELIGYFDNGAAVCFGIRIQKDKKNKIIKKTSGLYEYDIENKRGILHFSFPSDDFWEVLDEKGKRAPLIKIIYDTIIYKGYFNQEIGTEKFEKIKLKVQLLHMELLFEANSYWNKNNENKAYTDFVTKQSEIMGNLNNCSQANQIVELEELINQSAKIFKSLKKSLKN